MKTNTLLTYLLYALLVGLIAVVGYKACQMKREQAQTAKESAEFQKTLRDLGYIEEDSTGTEYTGDAATTTTPTSSTSPAASTKATDNTSAASDGIEDEDYTPPAPASKSAAPTAAKPAGKTSSNPATGSTATTTSTKEPAPATSTRERNLETNDYPSSDGRYRVIAGSFTVMDGARREMERVIKMGYEDAEVGRFNRGKYAVVIVKRTDSKSEAERIKADLRKKGIKAEVYERRQK